MNKFKILFHLNQVGYGGTEKAILTFCQNLDRKHFDIHLFINQPINAFRRTRLYLFRNLSSKQRDNYTDRLVNTQVRLEQFQQILGEENIYHGNAGAFLRLCRQLGPNIVHFNRGKWDKFFTAIDGKLPPGQCFVETNIFGYPAPPSYHNSIAAYYFVSNWLLEKSPWHDGKGRVLLNPIKRPASDKSLRSRHSIPDDAFVFGRISRPDLNDDDFILRAFERVADSNCYLFILAPTKAIREAHHSDRIILLEPTISEVKLSHFYNSLDALLHYRPEGETFGMNIAEAMLHGVPVISHDSDVDNAQLELLATEEDGEVGLISPFSDLEQYSRNMASLLGDRGRAHKLGNNARKRATRLYNEQVVTRTLEGYYRELMSN